MGDDGGEGASAGLPRVVRSAVVPMSSVPSTEPGRKVALAPAERSQPSSETEVATLLRRRMRVAFALIVAYSVLNIARELTRGAIDSAYARSVVGGNIGLGLIMSALTGLLWSKRRLSLVQLRRIEILGIALAALLVCVAQHLWYTHGRPFPPGLWSSSDQLPWKRHWFFQLSASGPGHHSMILSWSDASLVLGYGYCLNWVIGISLYGVFFPNTLRRGCFVIGGIIGAALFNLLLIALRSEPAVRSWYLGPVLLQVAATLGIGAVTGLMATYKLTELRQAVAAVRRLGQYRLFDRIGTGGMGEVYRAQHMFLRRPCAIKLIREDSQDISRSLQRFEREVQATASLRHPNIVDVYDYGRAEDGTFYYVMEFLDGLSLEQLVRRHGPLSPGRTVYLLRQVCHALAEAHTVGLIHRDIKPSNLFVCSRGTQHDVIKLLDFGLVQQSDAAAKTGDDTPPVILSALPSVSLPPGMPSLPSSFRTLPGSILGTPSFMSPEQIRAATSLDARSDLYSIGVVAFYLLTGHPPFRGATNMDVLAAHLTTPAPSLRTVVSDLPADLDAVVARCLAKEPKDRPASASELEEALATCTCASHWSARSAAAWWQRHSNDSAEEAKPSGALLPTATAAEQGETATAPAMSIDRGDPSAAVVPTVERRNQTS